MGTKIDRQHRYATRQILHSNTVHLFTVKHEYWRMLKSQGLTASELKFLEQRLKLLEVIAMDMSKLGTHIQKSLNKGAGRG